MFFEFSGILGVQRMERVERNGREKKWKKPSVASVVLQALRHKLSNCKRDPVVVRRRSLERRRVEIGVYSWETTHGEFFIDANR